VTEIGLFPLGIVLLPTEKVPLHIFEPRYRELIGECIDGRQEFGLVFADEDGIQSVGTRASVAEVVRRFPDGRLDVVVAGGERFRLRELTDGRSFHTGRVEPLVDAPGRPSRARVDEALALFAKVLEVAGAEAEIPDAGHPQLSFALAGCFELAPEVKQDLLQRTSEPERLGIVCEILEQARAAAVRRGEIHEAARRNGRVHAPRG
jgi:Lon protease-like protein